MDGSTLIAAGCLGAGFLAAAATLFAAPARDAQRPTLKHGQRRPDFDPRCTFFLIAPAREDEKARAQRRLLRPAISAFMAQGVAVAEIYGDAPPLRNGSRLDRIDSALLRCALGAPTGFRAVFVDRNGRTALEAGGPVHPAAILDAAGHLASAAALERAAQRQPLAA